MEKEEKRFNVEEHTTLDNKIIDVFPISHRYIHELETQLKKQQEIIEKAVEYIKTHLDKHFQTEFDYITTNPQELLSILEDKEV